MWHENVRGCVIRMGKIKTPVDLGLKGAISDGHEKNRRREKRKRPGKRSWPQHIKLPERIPKGEEEEG